MPVGDDKRMGVASEGTPLRLTGERDTPLTERRTGVEGGCVTPIRDDVRKGVTRGLGAVGDRTRTAVCMVSGCCKDSPSVSE